MLLVIIIAIVTGMSMETMVAKPWRWPMLLLAIACYLAGTVFLTLLDRRMSIRPWSSNGYAGIPFSLFRRHRFRQFLIQGWLVVGLAGLQALGLGQRLDDLLPAVPLLEDFLILLPFFIAVILMWTFDYPAHQSMRNRISASRVEAGEEALPCWSRREYIIFNLRHHLLFILVPISFILLVTESLDLWVFSLLPEGPYWDSAIVCMYLLAILVVFLFIPLLLVKVWKTSVLPAGLLREELEDMCGRMRVRYRKILVWESGGVLANAGAMGLIRQARYILISDALLKNMDAKHICAIFAHELAHIKQHHIFYTGLFAVATGLVCSAAAWGVALAVGLDSEQEAVVSVLFMVVSWAFGFGFVSRRFERQCDVIGAWASGPGGIPSNPADTTIHPEGANIFADSLNDVSVLNGMPLEQHNWRHGRMADRIKYVWNLGFTGGSRKDIDRVVFRIKLVLWAACLAGLAMAVLRFSFEMQ